MPPLRMLIQLGFSGRAVVTAFEKTTEGLAELDIRLVQLHVLVQVIFNFGCVVASRVGTFPWSQLTVN